MKITIAHLVEEARQAKALEDFVTREHPKATVKHSQKHPPYRHTYITIGERSPLKQRDKDKK